MAVFQYGFSHAEVCAASSPWLAMASQLSGATSRPGFSLARVKLVLEETWGCLLVAFINPGHSRVLRCGFLHFGVGWGQEHQSVMADSLGTIASSWWKERHDRRVTHSEPFFSLAGPGDLCTQKAASPSHTPWRRRKTTASIPNPELTPAPKTPLWWKPKQQPWSHEVHRISLSPPAAHKAVWLSAWTPSGFHTILGTHTEISTTNIQQLNTIMDTQCTMQEVFVCACVFK